MTRLDQFPKYVSDIDVSLLHHELTDLDVVKYKDNSQHELFLFKLGDPKSQRMILLPPYGMSFLLLSKLAKLLSKKFYVLFWESKGCPDYTIDMSDVDVMLTTQLQNFIDITKAEGFESFHFVGWCQAAQFLAYALAYSDIKPQTISWIAPAGLGCSLIKSEFERCALPVYLEIEKHGILYAEKLSKILDKYKDRNFSEKIAAEKLTMLHLSSPEMTFRFSKYMKSYENNKSVVNQLLEKILAQHEIMLIHCRDDTYSHYSESVELDKNYHNITLQLISEGGHLQLFNDPQPLADLIAEYAITRS